jgi:asparagine N-glycosylation enzyme membrane subunit Stt3
MGTPQWLRDAGMWVAAAIGIAIEAGLVWAVDRLPTWGQIVVYTIPLVLALIGAAHIVYVRRSVRKNRFSK